MKVWLKTDTESPGSGCELFHSLDKCTYCTSLETKALNVNVNLNHQYQWEISMVHQMFQLIMCVYL